MNIRTLVRTAAVKCNDLPLLNRLIRLPYRLALSAIVRLCRDMPEVKSLYLRHGLTRADWVPGLSDIDLTLVIADGLAPKDEYAWVAHFGTRYQSLQRRYPMLGELDYLWENTCSGWTAHGMRGCEVADWQMLYGEDVIECRYARHGLERQRDAMDYALTIFEEFLIPRFYFRATPSWLERRLFTRIATKVLRYAEAAGDQPLQPYLKEFESETDTLACLLEALDIRARQLLAASSARTSSPPQPLDTARAEVEFGVSRFAGLQAFASDIASLTLGYEKPFLVLQHAAAASTKPLLQEIRVTSTAEDVEPLLLTRGLFDYYLRVYRPHQCLSLRQNRYVAQGRDLLPQMVAPTPEALARALLNQSLNPLLAQANIALSEANATTPDKLIPILWQTLFLKLYLETGETGSQATTTQHCEQHYPALCEELYRLQECGPITNKAALSAYRLLGNLARDINHVLQQPGDHSQRRITNSEVVIGGGALEAKN